MSLNTQNICVRQVKFLGLVDGCPSNPTELDQAQPNLGSGIYIYYDCYLPPELNIQYKLQQRSIAVKTFKPLFHLQLLYFSLLPQGKNNKKFQTCQALPKVTVSNHHFVSWPEIINFWLSPYSESLGPTVLKKKPRIILKIRTNRVAKQIPEIKSVTRNKHPSEATHPITHTHTMVFQCDSVTLMALWLHQSFLFPTRTKRCIPSNAHEKGTACNVDGLKWETVCNQACALKIL